MHANGILQLSNKKVPSPDIAIPPRKARVCHFSGKDGICSHAYGMTSCFAYIMTCMQMAFATSPQLLSSSSSLAGIELWNCVRTPPYTAYSPSSVLLLFKHAACCAHTQWIRFSDLNISNSLAYASTSRQELSGAGCQANGVLKLRRVCVDPDSWLCDLKMYDTKICW